MVNDLKKNRIDPTEDVFEFEDLMDEKINNEYREYLESL